MVVMEYISSAKAPHRSFLPSPPSPLPKAETIQRDLTGALALLHGQDFVFGDLRLLNTLYSPEDDLTLSILVELTNSKEDRCLPVSTTTGDPAGHVT